ncbi:hypothetical protein AAF712_002506 [Marasmius tenuissimus]|uniref:Uncharacterized protein n=1 Tax=Marasmius tenuissimus TaxID=585030 RepID=A0ABR3AAD1_9AGAR
MSMSTYTEAPHSVVPNYETYKQQLQPLYRLETRLSQLLLSADGTEPTQLGSLNGAGNQTSKHVRSNSVLSPSSHGNAHLKRTEVAVHTFKNWKKAASLANKTKHPMSLHEGMVQGRWGDSDNPVHDLNNHGKELHTNRLYVGAVLSSLVKRLICFIADVLKARLKTLGVTEHPFFVTTRDGKKGAKWKIYDVGGARNRRHAWVPYFTDVDAIIFLVPISAFDQVLEEVNNKGTPKDRRVNRLEDSLLLWKGVISNKLLSNVSIMLFLNKCDLLRLKLGVGVRLADHLILYGDRPNDYESVLKYMKNKFGVIHQQLTANKERELYVHYTSVTDTHRTATIIGDVRDIIIRVTICFNSEFVW